MLALKDHWVWDSWYLHDGMRWHCWYLKAPTSIGNSDLRHWHVSHGHAVSEDMIHWEHRGTALSPSPNPAWDDMTVWTGSTLRGDDGRWHYFYTGTSTAEDGMIQRIGHAVGDDLESWERVGDGLCLDLTGSNSDFYETEWEGRWHDRAMRDPWVMNDPGGDGALMFFTARVPDRREINDAGCIGLATSADLMTWTLEAPVFVGAWGQLEVPQVFESNSTWYCLFSASPDHQAQWNIKKNGIIRYGSHYLMADSPRGPWRLPDGAGLDTGHDRYAARIVEQDGLRILGFKDGGREDFGGYIMNPAPVYRRPDGTLSLER
ncbi:MAG: levansucrase [Paracoccaceae bacterium]|nr:levansucrase [Paracoccaceae bacterium]